jgi:HPt (histidine-containing phosphotransfer) domain-containing protein
MKGICNISSVILVVSGPRTAAMSDSVHFPRRGKGSAMDRQDRLDRDTVRTLREMTDEGQPDFLEDLISLFLDTFSGQLASLIEYAEAGDLAGVQRISHDLKSSSASLGATALSSLCSELEAMAHAGISRGIVSLVTRIVREFHDVRPELEALVPNPA